MHIVPGSDLGDHRAALGADAPESSDPTSEGRPDVGSVWTDQRLQLHKWFAELAPALAPVYEATVRMATDPTFPGRVWFVAHALREIRNRLPNALAGPTKGAKTEYSDLAAKVTRCWIEDGLPADGSSPLAPASEPSQEGPARFEISAALLEAAGDLVSGHLAIGPRKKEGARRLFVAVSGGPVPDYAVSAWLRATNRAERFAHLRDEPLASAQEHEFEEIFAACEGALVAMANRSYENMDALDEILDAANH